MNKKNNTFDKMYKFTKKDFTKMHVCQAIIQASALISQKFPVQEVNKELQTLVASFRLIADRHETLEKKISLLIETFYSVWSFESASGVYELSETLWLNKVLEKKIGTAISLSAILLHIAHSLQLPLYPVIFPTQLILRADFKNYTKFINPFDGSSLETNVLEMWLQGNIGPLCKLEKKDLEKAQPSVLICKVLNTLKAALMEEKKMELALSASKLLVHLDPNDPYEIRDRGLIYAQLECEHIALEDLTYFIEQCPDDPITNIIRLQVHAIEQNQVALH